MRHLTTFKGLVHQNIIFKNNIISNPKDWVQNVHASQITKRQEIHINRHLDKSNLGFLLT